MQMPGLPGSVHGLARGVVTADDYQQVFAPLVDRCALPDKDETAPQSAGFQSAVSLGCLLGGKGVGDPQAQGAGLSQIGQVLARTRPRPRRRFRSEIPQATIVLMP
jgi:hypothetical protein